MMEMNDDHQAQFNVHVDDIRRTMNSSNNEENVTNDKLHMLDLIKNETIWHENHSNNSSDKQYQEHYDHNNHYTRFRQQNKTSLNVTDDIKNILRNIVNNSINYDDSNSQNLFVTSQFGGHQYPSTNNTSPISTLFNESSSLSNAVNGGSTIAPDHIDSTWWHIWQREPFPSGYSQLAIVLLAFFLTCVIILVVVGNLLVCIAIATEKSLKPVQNWFIASLAVSDLLLGLIIMPFSLARELMGYWMFGQVWCDIHAALDVLLCTASINSLFLISLDRYWSITQAVKYLKKRTPSRAAMMIAFVWIFSAFVSLPPLVGWKKAEQSSEYPQCNLSNDIGYVLYSSIGSFYFPALMMVFVYAKIFIAARSRARKHIAKKRFKIPANITTQETLKEKSTTTTLCTSFSNPSPPENINQQQQQQHQQQIHHHHHHQHHQHHANVDHNHDEDNNDDENHDDERELKKNLLLEEQHSAQIDQIQHSNTSDEQIVLREQQASLMKSALPPQIIIESSSESRRQSSWNIISTSEIISSINTTNTCTNPNGNNGENVGQQMMSSSANESESDCAARFKNCKLLNETNNESSEISINNSTAQSPVNQPNKRTYFSKAKIKTFKFQKSKINGLSRNTNNNSISKSSNANNNNNSTVDDDSDTADSPTNKEQSCESKSFLSAPKLLRSRFGSTLSIADYEDSDTIDDDHKNKNKKNRVQYQDQHQPMHLPSDAERHKRKIAKARERRATLIVGLIMAAFITAWLPFFVLYVLVALCQKCKETIPEGVFAVAFWLGYGNSAANPIIYTIFNRDYRRAFRKILFKR